MWAEVAVDSSSLEFDRSPDVCDRSLNSSRRQWTHSSRCWLESLLVGRWDADRACLGFDLEEGTPAWHPKK